jgi:hypothetical protein
MSSKIFSIFLTSFLILGLFSATSAKTRTYENERGDYALELPSASWSVVKLNGIAHPRTEFVNGKRRPVLLRIRKVYDATSPSDLVARHQSWDSLFLAGYMIGKDQTFEGRLSGTKYSYEYVKGGIPMAGLIYYLQGDDGFIYRLQFTGPQNRMWELREQMDSIAGSFRTEMALTVFTN